MAYLRAKVSSDTRLHFAGQVHARGQDDVGGAGAGVDQLVAELGLEPARELVAPFVELQRHLQPQFVSLRSLLAAHQCML